MTRWPGHPVSNQLKLAEKMEVFIRWRISSMHMKNLVPEKRRSRLTLVKSMSDS